MELVIDKREPEGVYGLIYDCPAWDSSHIYSELLDSGDFVLQYRRRKLGYKEPLNLVGIESKTWTDLANSLSTSAKNGRIRRLTKQLTMLQATYPVAALLVKGTYDTYSFESNPYKRGVRMWGGQGYRDTGWIVGMLEGFLLSVQDRGVRVVKVGEEGDLPYALAWLWKHYERFDPDQDVDHFSRGSMVPITMLDAVPGVGPIMARRLHDELDKADMGSIGGVIRASEEKLAHLTNGTVAREIKRRLS